MTQLNSATLKKSFVEGAVYALKKSLLAVPPSGTQDSTHFSISLSPGRRLLPWPKGDSARDKHSTPATLPRAQSQPRHLLVAQAALLLSSFQFPVVDPLLLHVRRRLFL